MNVLGRLVLVSMVLVISTGLNAKISCVLVSVGPQYHAMQLIVLLDIVKVYVHLIMNLKRLIVRVLSFWGDMNTMIRVLEMKIKITMKNGSNLLCRAVMKYVISSIVYVVLLFPSVALAYDFLGCTGLPLVWSQIMRTPGMDVPSSSNVCLMAAQNKRIEMNKVEECTASSESDPTNSSTCYASICCPVEVTNGLNNLEMTKAITGTITGVTQGQEKAAADAWANNYWATHEVPTLDGKIKTDNGRGMVYLSVLNEDNTTSVYVTVWKRAILTNIGDNAVPLGDIAGSWTTGNGQLSVEDISSGVSTGTSAGFAELKASMDAVAAGNAPLIAAIEGLNTGVYVEMGWGTGANFGSLESAINNLANKMNWGTGSESNDLVGALNNLSNKLSWGSTENSWGTMGVSAAPSGSELALNEDDMTAIKDNFVGSVSGSWGSFAGRAKATEFGGLIGSFFGNIPTGGTEAPVLIWDTGTRFGTHSLDLAELSVFFTILKSIVNAVSWFFANLFWSIKVLLSPLMYVAGQMIGLLIDGLLMVVLGIMSTLDLGILATHAAESWGALDSRVAWMINATGVAEGLSIIAVSMMIRFTVNLIPAEFTRV
jgi:hypothetical protein